MWRDQTLSEVEQMPSAEARVYALLRYMVRRYNAHGGLVATLRDGQPSLLCAHAFGMEDATLRGVWAKYRPQLEASEVIRGEETLAPIVGDSLMGFVYLFRPKAQVPAKSIGALCLAVAKSLEAPELLAPRVLVDPRQAEILELEDELKAQGGNISRVAQALGVTRRTVYLRMRRFDISPERLSLVRG